jgi:hypothetical protein
MDKAVLVLLVVGMAAADGTAFLLDGGDDRLFGVVLGRPADLIGGETKVSAGDKDDFGLSHELDLRIGGTAEAAPFPFIRTAEGGRPYVLRLVNWG